MESHPPSTPPEAARRWLNLAARFALRAQGHVEPNPMVGCVVVRDGRVIGAGHHRRFGGLHAEREALADCLRRGNDPRGATVFCTLEPCAGTGKQPPCTLALIEAGVSRVVYAERDPTPEKGGGHGVLERAGIVVEYSDASPLASGLAAPFVTRVRLGRPWVIAKWAQTIDGRIATRTGESKWISGEPSRRRVHRLRSRVDAILTGMGTVLADDPMLTPRLAGLTPRRRALRVVADSDLSIPLSSSLVQSAKDWPMGVACARELLDAEITHDRVRSLRAAGVRLMGVDESPSRGLDLGQLLRTLWREHQVASVLVEAGPGLLGSMLADGLIDEVVVYVAPMLLGDEMARAVATGRVAASLSNAVRFELCRVKSFPGGDVEITYRRTGRG